MRRLLVLPLVASCSFTPAALPAGGSIDAPIQPADAPLAIDARGAVDGPLRADAGGPDGPPDAPPPDAPPPDAGPPDAEPDPCPLRSTPLTLGTIQDGQLEGTSRYLPTCSTGNSSGPESFFHVDVTGATSTELVVDVSTTDAGLDNVLDVTGSCMGSPGVGTCADTGAAGAGEVVVVPLVASGRRYITVDSAAGGHGHYSLLAFLRAVVTKGAACSPELTTSRCQLGEYCVDLTDDGVDNAKCEDLTTVTDSGFNDDPCAASGNPSYKLSADSAYFGALADAADVDVLELDPTRDAKLRVVVADDQGGCPVDLGLDLVTGADCASTTPVATDENSGLGPCPLLKAVPLTGGQRYWLKVRAGAGAAAHVKDGVMYTLVIDFVY